MIRIILDHEGRVLAVEDTQGNRGVVWAQGSVSLARFIEGVNQEFPELAIRRFKGNDRALHKRGR